MFDTLMKHAKHFTKADHPTTAAQVVHIDAEGHLFMTDSHIAVLAKNVSTDNPNRTIKPDGKPSDVPIYSYEKFFNNDITETLELDVKEMLLMTQALEAVSKVEEFSPMGAFRFETVEDQYKIFFKGIEFTSTYELMKKEPNQIAFKIHFDVSLLTKAFKLLKDLKADRCLMQFAGAMRPCYFSSLDESVRVVVMPCRTY